MAKKQSYGACPGCGKDNLSRDEVGINIKLLGENIEKPMCIPCLAEYLEISQDDLLDKISEFKAQGCKLFG